MTDKTQLLGALAKAANLDKNVEDIIEKETSKILQKISQNKEAIKIIKAEKITKKELIENIDIFVDLIESKNDFKKVLKRDENGNLKAVFVSSEQRKKDLYKKNFWLTSITKMNFDLDIKDLINENKKGEELNEVFSRFQNILQKDVIFEPMYLYGGLGVGKTTFLQAIAVYFAKQKNKTVAFLNASEMCNYFLSSIGDDKVSINDVIEKLKKVDFLFIDDIGAEKISGWFRDNVLFSILNHRVENKKYTSFSSNFSQKQLIEIQATETKNNTKETLRAERLVERIRSLAKEYKITGKNLRHK
ncbi:DnaA ATPase domain-containing protein [Mycoplasma procyoni]|uniref:DnaA ATPase domain-containing protein n=1 Tax=Mycoplasma procyoni TaxID=568784 RepID=UPI00197C1471|nr:DnaA/Hda family protein [Mycoplasma procyoni]MBN3534616.1 ATP-binding protein [Mycoplasma procyoni]